MSRRDRVGNWLKERKGDVKTLLGRKEGISRPAIPSALQQTESNERSTGEDAVRSIANGAIPPSATLISLSSQISVNVNEAPDADSRRDQAPQSAGAVEEGASETTGPSRSVVDTGLQTNGQNVTKSTATNIDTSGSNAHERADAVIQAQEEGNNTQAVEDPPTHAPQQTANSTSAKWKGLIELARVLGPVTDLFGPVKEVVDMFMGCIAEAARAEYDEVQGNLEGLLHDMAGYFSQSSSLTMTKSMESICGSIKQELNNVSAKLGRTTGVRHLKAGEDVDAIVRCYRRIETHLRRLTLNTNMEMWKVVEEQAAESRSDRMSSRVDRLPSALPAWYDSAEGIELKRRACTAGTRVDVLATIFHWTGSPRDGAVYWLNGMAGTGKTTIAYSVCAELDALHHLGASFFCSRLREECRNVNMIIPSIAYQLARFSRPFQLALSKVLEKDPDVHGRLPHMQFDALIAKPILEVQDTLPEGVTVVIDALDECEQKESTARMLDVLLTNSASLPIKFIVSSRPETQIRDQMTDERAKCRLVLHELDKGKVQLDIEKYLRECLAEMSPSDGQIAALVERAGILFIYAATAVRYIGYDNFQSDPEGRLGDILDGQQSGEDGGNWEIDELYTTILKAALNNRGLRKAQRDDMLRVLHTVICAREPLTVNGLSELLGIKAAGRVRAALRPLWSVLHVVGGSELVTTLHASFPDFMFDSARSNTYYCDFFAHHRKLAEHCLEYIAQTVPQFNICRLESSYLPDEKVPDIEKRVANAISSELSYACRYWADHVNAASCALSVIEHIRDFLSTRLLIWMEIMNLKDHMKDGMKCVKLLNEWCKGFEGEQELTELAHDAKRFVEAFASNPVSRSTPHIYLSMLAFWPKSAPIVKHYAKYAHGPVVAKGTVLDRRQMAHLSTWAFGKPIEAMVVFPDGLHVGLAIENEVLVVDSSSGKVVLGPIPLQGYLSQVKAIAFSHDGSRILAGSFDDSIIHVLTDSNATILGWDTSSGKAVLGPLQLRVHQGGSISCLNFSPDCSRIITGSADKALRLWNAQTGETLLRLETRDVCTVTVFSPDGTRVAAGSRFGKTLQVWDSQSGDTILGPVTVSDLDHISLIALSPDNTRIIYASGTGKIAQTGDVQSGDTVFREIAKHPTSIHYIAYSHDGKHVVSAAHDRAVRIWDTETSNMVLGPLEAHTNTVGSVSFSPDGSRIISACKGGLVCTWDAQRHRLAPNSTNTTFHHITCVKFSSDGTRFVSGTEEGTICIWDANTGELAVGPVKVQFGRIDAVDFKGDRVVVGSDRCEICVCDALSAEVVLGPFKVGSYLIKSIAYSPRGNVIATGSYAGVNVWNAQDGSRVLGPLTDLSGVILSIQFSPDGTLIVAGSQGYRPNIAVWDVSDGRNVFGTLDGHNSWVYSVSYSPNGTLIASASADKTIILWDAYTGKKIIGPLTGHSDFVYSVSFSPDSTRLVSGSGDETIRIWDTQIGEMLFELSHMYNHSIMSVEYSPDGTRVLSHLKDKRSGSSSVRIHDARSPEERAQMRSEFDVGDWTMDKDGWVVDDQSRLLVWVPGDLRKALPSPSTLKFRYPSPSQEYLRLEFDGTRMGESWAQGYESNL